MIFQFCAHFSKTEGSSNGYFQRLETIFKYQFFLAQFQSLLGQKYQFLQEIALLTPLVIAHHLKLLYLFVLTSIVLINQTTWASFKIQSPTLSFQSFQENGHLKQRVWARVISVNQVPRSNFIINLVVLKFALSLKMQEWLFFRLVGSLQFNSR